MRDNQEESVLPDIPNLDKEDKPQIEVPDIKPPDITAEEGEDNNKKNTKEEEKKEEKEKEPTNNMEETKKTTSSLDNSFDGFSTMITDESDTGNGKKDAGYTTSSLPDLPSSAEIDIKTKNSPKERKESKKDKGVHIKENIKIASGGNKMKNLLAIAAVLFFLAGLGISIPAIKEQMTLSNRASGRDVGTQACYMPCDNVNLKCKEGLVCGAIKNCDEDDPEDCQVKNVCYTPQCKENSTCDCSKEAPTKQVAKPTKSVEETLSTLPPTELEEDLCRFNTRTAVLEENQLIESVTNSGLIWNFDEEGKLWQTASEEGDLIKELEKYKKGPCKEREICDFDTRVTYKEDNKTVESVTIGNRLWNYDLSGEFLEDTTEEGQKLSDIEHYKAGPCKEQEECAFTTRSFTIINDELIEIITVEDRYWKFDSSKTLMTDIKPEGNLMSDVEHYAKGPCKDKDPCIFDTQTFFPDGENYIETITVGDRYWNFDPEGKHWGNSKEEGVSFSIVDRFKKLTCKKLVKEDEEEISKNNDNENQDDTKNKDKESKE
jgi:hypothetical protein